MEENPIVSGNNFYPTNQPTFGINSVIPEKLLNSQAWNVFHENSKTLLDVEIHQC